MIANYPLDLVTEAYDQMHSDEARFRVVLTFAGSHISSETILACNAEVTWVAQWV